MKLIALIIALIGIITVLLGATLAFAQKDIKRGLAYYTMSQLGYTMLALSTGSYRAALGLAYSKTLLFFRIWIHYSFNGSYCLLFSG
jgi:NAD(P)H-quinone oxidoreductase subunit 5